MRDRMTIEECENEVLNGELRNVTLGKNSIRGLLYSFSNGSNKLEDYGDVGTVSLHILEPCGYHFEIVKNK